MLKPSTLSDIKGGLVASTACVAFSIANGALIYSGTLEPMLVHGIAAGLVTTAVTSMLLALTSTFRPVIATANSTTAAPLGAIMVTTAPALAELPTENAVATVCVLVATTTIITGVLLILLGSARLGKLVRFTPFPVVAGFMGVTGTLLTLGAIRFGTGVRVVWADLPRFASTAVLPLLAATLAFAALIFAVTRRFKHPLVLPGLLVAATLLVNAAVYAAGYSADNPPLPGLFLMPQSMAPINLPLFTQLPFEADWHLIPPLYGSIAAYAVLVVMATLLTSTGLETALNVDADYDRELRAEGLASVASGVLGGFVGNPLVGSTMAGVSTGARTHVAGLTNGFVALGVLLVGLPLLQFIPRFVLGGMLAQIGLTVVYTWCIATRHKMPSGEWALVAAIVVVTVWAGLVPAILLGLVGGCILFALDVSRIGVVRRIYGLDRRASPLVRPSEELAALLQHGHRVRFVELQGTLFFGSAYQILMRVKDQIASDPPGTVVLDLSAVTGCDSSTAAILARMRRLLSRDAIAFGVAGGAPRVLALLRSAGCLLPGDAVYATRAEALETAEAAILRHLDNDLPRPKALGDWLGEALGDHELAQVLLPNLHGAEHVPGSYLCRQGEPTDTLMFIESGRVAVMIGAEDAEVCVRVFGPRTIAGEHAFVLQLPRTASLKVEEPARVWTLQRRSFDLMASEQPALVIALLRELLKLQSERLAFATRQNATLA